MFAALRRVMPIAVTLALLAHSQAQADGALVYANACSGCHGAAGQGVPGVFPPLAGHVGGLYAAPDGPRHLANVLLFGMQGPITVAGTRYDGMMPGWFQLSDGDIAAVIDYVLTAWGDADAIDGYTAIETADVAAARRGGLSPQGVYERRPSLDAVAESNVAELSLATFAPEQIERIRRTYEIQCVECHGESFDGGLIGGPPLIGGAFLARWGGKPVGALYRYTQSQMPQGGPGSLSPQQYADLVALILSVNGHVAGAALPTDVAILDELAIRTP
jgi:mono/diheme cytochrome c family protein